jgi:hypothetical protein
MVMPGRRVNKEEMTWLWDRPQALCNFKFERQAKSLIEPARKCGAYHRSRESYYVKELEKAERELRDKGVSVEVWNPEMGAHMTYASLTSGSMGGSQKFEAKIDQKLLDAVTVAKTKMIEHRKKAESYEKYARAFNCAPEVKVELTVEDCDLFKLEG